MVELHLAAFYLWARRASLAHRLMRMSYASSFPRKPMSYSWMALCVLVACAARIFSLRPVALAPPAVEEEEEDETDAGVGICQICIPILFPKRRAS